jgi:hypothetical protein
MDNPSDIDRYLDLKSLSVYSSLAVSTLRYHIRKNGLPYFRIPGAKGKTGKILIKTNEFNGWMGKYRMNEYVDLDSIANDVIDTLKQGESES